jgi:hypothetical protein
MRGDILTFNSDLRVTTPNIRGRVTAIFDFGTFLGILV